MGEVDLFDDLPLGNLLATWRQGWPIGGTIVTYIQVHLPKSLAHNSKSTSREVRAYPRGASVVGWQDGMPLFKITPPSIGSGCTLTTSKFTIKKSHCNLLQPFKRFLQLLSANEACRIFEDAKQWVQTSPL